VAGGVVPIAIAISMRSRIRSSTSSVATRRNESSGWASSSGTRARVRCVVAKPIGALTLSSPARLPQSCQPLVCRSGRCEHRCAPFVEGLPCIRQHEPTGRAAQQRHPCFTLQLPDLLTHCRGREPERPRGAAHRTALHHCHQEGHPAQVHCEADLNTGCKPNGLPAGGASPSTLDEAIAVMHESVPPREQTWT
jgi:hypothetical protein